MTLASDTPPIEAWRWWEARRLRYNGGLAMAAVLAWSFFLAEMAWLYHEFSLGFSMTLAHGLAWLIVMAVANVLYFLGPISELVFRPADVSGYRRRMFALGFWFSAAVPFLLPAIALVPLLALRGY